MKKYISLIRSGMLMMLRWRIGMLVILFGNLIYIIIVYNLWKSIFASAESEIINGMTFASTMVYLVLASSIFALLEGHLTWRMNDDIQTGKIISDLIKPMGYQIYKNLGIFGETIFGVITTFIPTFIIIYFLSDCSIQLTYNIVFFVMSMFLGITITLSIDFFVGTICLYTQSIWGVNMIKEVIVLLFSGAVIPLNFFPDQLRSIVMFMPFQAIYNTPLKQLLDENLTIKDRLVYLGIQLLWVVVMLVVSKIFWNKSIKKITVNGG